MDELPAPAGEDFFELIRGHQHVMAKVGAKGKLEELAKENAVLRDAFAEDTRAELAQI